MLNNNSAEVLSQSNCIACCVAVFSLPFAAVIRYRGPTAVLTGSGDQFSPVRSHTGYLDHIHR